MVVVAAIVVDDDDDCFLVKNLHKQLGFQNSNLFINSFMFVDSLTCLSLLGLFKT